MVVEADDLDQVVVVVVVLLQVLTNDLLEAVDDELLAKRGWRVLGNGKLLIGLIVGLEFFHVKKGKTESQPRASGVLLHALLVHSQELLDKLLAVFFYLG